MALTPYTLEQAETDIGDLRGQVDRLQEFIADNDGGGIYIDTGTWIAVDPVNGGEETWHSLGSPSATGYTSDHGRYRMTPEGEVEFDLLLHGTSGNGTAGTYTYANTLPTAYRPAFTRAYPLGSTGSTFGGSVAVSTAGVVSIGVAAVARLGNVFTMPLD